LIARGSLAGRAATKVGGDYEAPGAERTPLLLLAGVACGSLGLIAVFWLARRHEYWNFSEGVYLLSARQFADGQDL
jgi:hypothetical protein